MSSFAQCISISGITHFMHVKFKVAQRTQTFFFLPVPDIGSVTLIAPENYSTIYSVTRKPDKQDISSHQVALHPQPRPYQCELCHRAFKEKSNYLQHRQTHTGEKPYKCEVCLMCFTRRTSLRRHLNRAHHQTTEFNQDTHAT